MPELPEVETVVRDLRPGLVGRQFLEMHIGKHKLRRPWQDAWTARVLHNPVQAIHRRGKWIQIQLHDGFLIVHLGMTGQFQILPRAEQPPAHTHLEWVLDSPNQALRYTDIRRFGSVQWFTNLKEWEASVNEPLGPEPWDLTTDYFRGCLQEAKRSLKAILLDQGVVAGVGNIYADESLFFAGIRPTTLGCELSKPRMEKLRLAVQEILTRAVESRGSTIRNYVGGSGLKGGFQDSFHVYGRTDQPCLVCGNAVECIRLAGRSTHYCPKCQKA